MAKTESREKCKNISSAFSVAHKRDFNMVIVSLMKCVSLV